MVRLGYGKVSCRFWLSYVEAKIVMRLIHLCHVIYYFIFFPDIAEDQLKVLACRVDDKDGGTLGLWFAWPWQGSCKFHHGYIKDDIILAMVMAMKDTVIQPCTLYTLPSKVIATELKTTMMICMKLGLKTITIKEKISGDFMIQECDVDGCAVSKMKVVMVRQ